MRYTVSAETLRKLYGAMLEEPPTRPLMSTGIIKTIADSGWAFSWQVEDLFSMADRRLECFQRDIDLDEVAAAFGVTKQDVVHRPRSASRGAVIYDAYSAMDFASLLISLEGLGFGVDPSPLVHRLLPTVPKRGYITNSALDVLWFERCRFKYAFTLKAAESGRLSDVKDHKLPGGYKAEVWIDVEGNPASITAKGPKHRRTKEPVAVECDCGQTWYKGDPESSLAHRKEHKIRMSYLDPQPHPKMLTERNYAVFHEHVDLHSAGWRHDEMYSRALAFKREKKYDFVQWSKREDDPNVHGFLFTDDDGRIVGACAFRYRAYENAAPRWGLQWIWIARPHRRRGVLKSRWAGFRERFGDFDVESPGSDAMKAFLDAVGDAQLIANETPQSFGSQAILPAANVR